MPPVGFVVVFSSRKKSRKKLEDSDCRTWMAICARPEDPESGEFFVVAK